MPEKKRRKWKGPLLLLSIVCGILYFVDQRYDFFRLRGLEITPGRVLPEAVIWEAVPKEAQNFWPALLFGGVEFKRKIESFYPVGVDLKVLGWGSYRIEVRPLEVMLNVSWNSRIWLLSTNGKMWFANLPANTEVRGLNLAALQKPILAWDAGLALPIDPERQGGDIYPSSLPVDKIKRWYETVEKAGWADDIYCLLSKKIDGKPVVQILFGTEGAITGEVIVRDDTANWLSLAAAMKEIYPEAEYMKPPGMIINATYTDLKFTVTDKGSKSHIQ